MPKQITRTIYVTEDGEEFASHDEAQAHELTELLNSAGTIYLQRYTAEKIAMFVMSYYTLTPKPAAELLSEDPDHGDSHAN
jgi:hypothetical protein